MARLILTLGPIGYLPAPGTMGTLATIPFVYLLHTYFSAQIYGEITAFLFFLGIYLIQKTVSSFADQKDPSCIVFDELVGCLITFACVPFNYKTVIVGFVLFRLFDISKFGLIKKIEQLPGAWGIMGDDLVAALLANIMLHMFLAVLV